MIKLKAIYQLSFYILLSLVFIIGGVLQFFIGIPNTVMTIGLIFLMLFNYFLYVSVKKKVVLNKVILFAALYFLLIFLSGLINKSHILNIAIYCIFPLLPLSTYLFFYVNKTEKYIKIKNVYKLFIIIGIIQLPILLIQRNFFDFLIVFNNSGQSIIPVDFLFGSFLLKSDHSLGCFILLLCLTLLFNVNNVREHIKYPILISTYLTISLMLSESNISKAMLILVWVAFIANILYKKIRSSTLFKRILLGFAIISVSVVLYNIRNIDLITTRLGGTLEKNYTVKKSYQFFQRGIAKREQIVISAIHKLDTKYIGDGPYSYFDIKTGKFKQTIHFSQLIWTYFDLGLLGLFILILFVKNLIKSSFNTGKKILYITISLLFAVYMFYTTPFSEIGILLSFFILFNFSTYIQYNNNFYTHNEYNSNTISRLEKK